MGDRYLTVDEMSEVSQMCRLLWTLEEAIRKFEHIDVFLTEAPDGEPMYLPVYDASGDPLGYIGYADGGFALYLEINNDV